MRTDKEMLHAIIEIIEAHNLNFPNLVNDIRARLAEPEDEPVAWSSADGYVYRSYTVAKHSNNGKEPLPLYRHPPRHLVWLTDDELRQIIRQTIPDTTVSEMVTFRAIASAIKSAVMVKADD